MFGAAAGAAVASDDGAGLGAGVEGVVVGVLVRGRVDGAGVVGEGVVGEGVPGLGVDGACAVALPGNKMLSNSKATSIDRHDTLSLRVFIVLLDAGQMPQIPPAEYPTHAYHRFRDFPSFAIPPHVRNCP